MADIPTLQAAQEEDLLRMSGQRAGPPSWLFSNNSSSSAPSCVSEAMAKNTKAQQAEPEVPPTQLMDMVETFLSEHAPSAHKAFKKHRANNGAQREGGPGHHH